MSKESQRKIVEEVLSECDWRYENVPLPKSGIAAGSRAVERGSLVSRMALILRQIEAIEADNAADRELADREQRIADELARRGVVVA